MERSLMVTALDLPELDSAASLIHQSGEFAGVLAFAMSGALVAVRRDLDVVGIILLAVATALGGGIVRDVVIGNTPPAAFSDLRYLAVAASAALIVCLWRPPGLLTRWPLDITDAVGLGLFAVTGTVIAYSWGLAAPSAALLGMTTAIGGGVIRDVLSGQIPSVLRPGEHLYAIPALIAASITATLLYTDVYRPWMGLCCAGLAFVVRMASLRFGWHGPRPWYVARAG